MNMGGTSQQTLWHVGWRLAVGAWESASVYLPIILMGFMALGTYWLARNTPTSAPTEVARPATHEPDYFMRGFAVKSFAASGRLQSEVRGIEARHFPDTDLLEVTRPRIEVYNERGELSVATAQRALVNSDGSEVQLIGDAVVTRQAVHGGATARQQPSLELRGEFLHAFLDTEQVRSHRPVTVMRGADQFRADSLYYDNVARVVELRGSVHGTLAPRAGATMARGTP